MKDASLAFRIWRDFRRGFWQFLAFDLYYKILAATVLTPLATWATARLISLAGPSVSNDDIVSFLLSPLGVVTVLFSGAVLLATLYIEDAGLMVLARDAAAGEKTSALKGLWVTAKRWPWLLGDGLLLATLYALALLPFLTIAGLAYKYLLTGHDINYMLTEKPPEFWIAAGVALVTFAGAVLVTVRLIGRALFVIPNTMLGGARPLGALRESARLAKKAWTRVVGSLAAWNAIIALAAALGTFILIHAADVIFDWMGDRLGPVVAAAAIIGVLYLLGSYFLSFVWIVGNALMAHHLRLELLEAAEAPPPEIDPTADVRLERAGRLYRFAPAMSVAILIAACAVSAFAFFNKVSLEHDVFVTAHRGSSRMAPENSLSAIEQAIADGADFAEIDVQQTADGVVVLLHDQDLMRVAGVASAAHELTYEEIRELDAGAWFSPRFAGERIPTLEEAIELARGRIRLQIELKPHGPGNVLAERVVDIVNAEEYSAEAQIMSLDYASVSRVRELDPELDVGYLIFRSLTDPSRLDVDYLSVNQWIATESLIKSAQRSGKEVHVWTVDDPRRMNSLIDLGVDNLITNDPATLRALIDKRAELNDVERLLLVFKSWLRQQS